MRTISMYIMCFLFVFLVTGCGNPKVTGKVTFQDGSPLTAGRVCFDNGTHTFKGTIKQDGTYRMGGEKEGNGVPPGSYKVTIVGATKNEFSDNAKTSTVKGMSMPMPMPAMPKVIQLIDSKYSAASTSGLEVEVKGGMTYNIQVDPPKF